ncbi:MAG: ribose ABC transporter permease [Fusobacteriaceae bacterium]
MFEKLKNQKPVIGLIFFIIIVSIINPRFLTTTNIMNVLRQTSVNSVIAIGMTLVILTGGIDLSVGSILAFCGAIAAATINFGVSTPLALVITLVVGLVLGLINGFFIAVTKLQSFIVTLVMMTLLRGLTLVFTDGKPISVNMAEGSFFESVGGGYIFGIPIPIYIMILLFFIIWYILINTRFGRYIYAIGGNEEATKLSGISTTKIKIWVYGLSGFFASLAAVITTSRLGSAQPTAGQGYELDAIAAVVLGGTSLSGGYGKITGTALGAVIIGILANALNLLDVSSYYQMMVKAAVILAAVLIDKKIK